MPEETPPPSDQPNNDEFAPSDMFLEMMRAAARRADAHPPPDSDAASPTTGDEIPVDNPPEASTPEIAAPTSPSPSNDELVSSADDAEITPHETLPVTHDSVVLPDDAPPAKVTDAEVTEKPASELPIPPMPEDSATDVTYDDTRAIHTRPDIQAPKFPEEKPPTKPKRAGTPIQRTRVPIYPTPEPDGDDERQAKLEEQRIQRLQRRQERRQRRRVGIIGGFLRTMLVAFFAAALASTIFTWFTEPDFISPSVASSLIADSTRENQAALQSNQAAATPTLPQVTPNYLQRVGIVSGHRGPENDPGAVCDDGLQEVDINFQVAQAIVTLLTARGYTVDLLDEFDPRLEAYRASALVSIHANDCRDYGPDATAFLVSRAAARPPGGADDILAECIALHYGGATGLERRLSLTLDMTDYHTFREIHPLTPAAIIEIGFMRNDRDLLTNRQDVVASGIVEGIQCFLRGDNPLTVATVTPFALPTVTPE